MKAIIFAGGAGTRFWPISRRKLPKIFIPLLNGTSTFQMQVERTKKVIGIENIYVSTNEQYVSIVKEQTPDLPTTNIIAEPARKDLLAALGFALIKLKKMGVKGPVTYLASDHIINRPSEFEKALFAAEELIKENDQRFVFYGEKPLYATNNLGWINIGKPIKKLNGVKVVEYKKWIYRPAMAKCKKMFKTKQWVWNVNYETFTIDFALSQYQKTFPKNYKKLQEIEKSLDTARENSVTKRIYPTLEVAHSDDLWASAKPNQAVVLNLNLEWSDPGTLFALKQTLEPNAERNAVRGNVFNYQTKNCLVFNYEDDKLLTTMNLEGMVVINTKDTILVVPKDYVRFISEMLQKFEDTDYEKYL